MSAKGKKRKHAPSPELSFSDNPPIQKLKIKPIPELSPGPSSSKKHGKKRKLSPIPTTSISPTGDGSEDGGLKMKIILSPKKVKVENNSPEEGFLPKSASKGKKKGKQIKAKLVFEDQVLTLDGGRVTHQGKGGRSLSGSTPSPEQTKSGKKKKKESDKLKIKAEPVIPPFTKVSKSAEKAKSKSARAESDSGYSDTPMASTKSKKMKAKLQTLEEQPVPSPQASDSMPKKKKKDKDKKKKKMFKFKGDRNRFLNVKGSSDEEADDSLSRSLQDEDSLGGAYDVEDDYESSSVKKEKHRDMDRFMMPQMPVPDYSLEKKAAESHASSLGKGTKRDDRKQSGMQSSRAEDLIFQLTAYGSEMETIYPSYMLAPEEEESTKDDGWIKIKKKKKKKLGKDKKKKKKLKVVERDEFGNVKYVMRKTKLSGYMLWCRSYRSTFVSQNPGLDFSTISRRMGALWQTLDESEKDVWRKREITVNSKVPLKRLKKGKGSLKGLESPPPFTLQQPSSSSSHDHTAKHKSSKSRKLAAAAAAAAAKKKKSAAARKKPLPVKITPPKWNPIDCAAYLKLLGESLSGVGGKLQNHNVTAENIEVHGSVSVLLDSMLCALGPLLCLTEQLPDVNGVPKKTKTGLLNNIAYIMPGL